MVEQLSGSPVRLYLGTEAILARLGYRSRKTLQRLIVLDGLPCYKRKMKLKRVWCISESAVTAWELAKGAHWVSVMRARQSAKQNRGKHALTA